ncbi:MAG: tetratricopeptide repeat protein [Granulosicoccus sp.]
MFTRIVSTIMALSVMMLVSACATTTDQRGTGNTKPPVDLFMMSVNAQRAYQQSRWPEAVRIYQQIVQHVPTDAIAWFRLANTYARQGAYQRAIQAYEQSLTFDSEQPKAWFNLSTAHLLNAQTAMQYAQTQMLNNDPAKNMVSNRLQILHSLVHGGMEEGASVLSRRTGY